jgi:hypothetical protein
VPTTLQTLMGRLDDWLRMQPTRSTVTNPKLPGENFSPLFGTDDQYSNFRTVIARYRKWIDEAHATEGRQESIKAWQKVFGAEFAKASVIKVAADAASEGVSRVRGLLSSTAAHLNELVDVVKNYGISVLPFDFARPPHIRQPPWRQAPNLVTIPEDLLGSLQGRASPRAQECRATLISILVFAGRNPISTSWN